MIITLTKQCKHQYTFSQRGKAFISIKAEPFHQTEPGAHLFTQGAVAALLEPVQLVRLSQQGVEGLPRAVHRGGVRGDGEGRHVAQLLQGALALGRLVEELVVLQVLRQALQHGQRLVEIDLELKITK